jgi:hypothetical protein
MERPAFQKLQEFRADIKRRAALLRGRELKILTELAESEKDFPEAAIQGGAKVAQEKIDGLASQLGAVRRELAALQNPPLGGRLGTLVKEAWQEATNIITGDLRKNWEAKVVELDELKKSFLAVVGELGKIKAKADGVSAGLMESLISMPGPKLAIPSLATGVSERHKTGVIYVNPQESEKSFKGV